jgi:hypothetical protein
MIANGDRAAFQLARCSSRPPRQCSPSTSAPCTLHGHERTQRVQESSPAHHESLIEDADDRFFNFFT